MTYSYAMPVPGGWIGIVCSDPERTHPLYESATVCMTEEAAEMQAADECYDALDLVREMDGRPACLERAR